MAMAEYSHVDYFQEIMSSIDVVQNLSNGQQVQLNPLQCQYLSVKLTGTGSFLRAQNDKLVSIHDLKDIRRKALLKLHFTVKRAEKLVRNCCCETQSWLESAVTLAQIREDIVNILLDLRWWTSMVEIAIASVTRMSSSQQNELKLLKRAEEDFESLSDSLHSSSNDLQEAAIKDRDTLLEKLQELETSYAGITRTPQQNHEYLLAVHVRSRLENSEVASMADLNFYDDVTIIGMGGFGAVMNVRWLGRRCALKILKYQCKKEATSLSSFQHPHIVQFYRYWEVPYGWTPSGTPHPNTSMHPQQSHILMELLLTDLSKHMDQLIAASSLSENKVRLPMSVEWPMSVDVVIDIMLQVAKAMWHVHSKDVAHRDLKPSNVLVTPVSRNEVPELSARGYLCVKLADFGLAKAHAMTSAFSSLPVVGTKAYSAPEIFTDMENISGKRFPRKADVWSFGIMFAEILSGKQPFLTEGHRFGELQSRIKNGLRPKLRVDCPDYLKFCITSCWHIRPEDRPRFSDLWRMLRLAEVRGLGLVKEDHDLFTYKTRDSVRRLHPLEKTPAPDLVKQRPCLKANSSQAPVLVKQRPWLKANSSEAAMARRFQPNYFDLSLNCIGQVQARVSRKTTQLNPFQCQYLAEKLTKTGTFLRARTESLVALHDTRDDRRTALLHLFQVLKRAEILVGKCCYEGATWLDAAVDLAQIKEDVADILLELRWWTSMLDISLASVITRKQDEVELLISADEDFEMLRDSLYSESGDLEVAALKDRDGLLRKVAEKQAKTQFASRVANEKQIIDSALSVHVQSRLSNGEEVSNSDSLNAYKLMHIRGQGSFGMVLVVKWFGRKCALKILKVKCAKEATNLNKFQHPNIVQFFRYWEAPYLASTAEPLQSHVLMELMPSDLANHVAGLMSKRRVDGMPISRMPEPVIIDVMLQVAKAMWRSHKEDVVHRDLKPNNVLVRPVNKKDVPELSAQGYLGVKLADFGLAKAKVRSATYADQTHKVGATFYAAPEVFSKDEENNEDSSRRGDRDQVKRKKFPRRADVWSFGIMFSELLTGQKPFEDVSPGDLHSRIKKEGLRPDLPEGCPSYLRFCITSCWNLNPEDRPNFSDIWKMLRIAKVRSLGLVHEDYDFFTTKFWNRTPYVPKVIGQQNEPFKEVKEEPKLSSLKDDQEGPQEEPLKEEPQAELSKEEPQEVPLKEEPPEDSLKEEPLKEKPGQALLNGPWLKTTTRVLARIFKIRKRDPIQRAH